MGKQGNLKQFDEHLLWNKLFHPLHGLQFAPRRLACSHRVLPRELPGHGVVALPVSFAEHGNFGHQRVIRVRVGQQRTD